MYLLEDRILFDGAAAADVATAAAALTAHKTFDDHKNQPPPETHDTSSTDSTAGSTDHSHDQVQPAHPSDIHDLVADALTNTNSTQQVHVLVISESLLDADTLAQAAASDTKVITYDPTKTSLETLLGEIKTALNGQKADSIAFAVGTDAKGDLVVSSSDVTSLSSLSSDTEQQAFWAELGKDLKEGGRIDILSSSVASTDNGRSIIHDISDLAGAAVAASDDLTGGTSDADWFLEVGNVDVKSVYFNGEKLDSWDQDLTISANLATTKSVAFINTSIDANDLATMEAQLKAQNISVVEVSGDNAVQEITDYLNSSDTVYDSIQLIGHGQSDAIIIGDNILTNANVQTYASQLASWGTHLTQNGDILVYGCDVADSATGKALVQQIADLTGADVAASTDTTGVSGNWTLEYATGNIETANMTFSDVNINLYGMLYWKNTGNGEWVSDNIWSIATKADGTYTGTSNDPTSDNSMAVFIITGSTVDISGIPLLGTSYYASGCSITVSGTLNIENHCGLTVESGIDNAYLFGMKIAKGGTVNIDNGTMTITGQLIVTGESGSVGTLNILDHNTDGYPSLYMYSGGVSVQTYGIFNMVNDSSCQVTVVGGGFSVSGVGSEVNFSAGTIFVQAGGVNVGANAVFTESGNAVLRISAGGLTIGGTSATDYATFTDTSTGSGAYNSIEIADGGLHVTGHFTIGSNTVGSTAGVSGVTVNVANTATTSPTASPGSAVGSYGIVQLLNGANLNIDGGLEIASTSNPLGFTTTTANLAYGLFVGDGSLNVPSSTVTVRTGAVLVDAENCGTEYGRYGVIRINSDGIFNLGATDAINPAMAISGYVYIAAGAQFNVYGALTINPQKLNTTLSASTYGEIHNYTGTLSVFGTLRLASTGSLTMTDSGSGDTYLSSILAFYGNSSNWIIVDGTQFNAEGGTVYYYDTAYGKINGNSIQTGALAGMTFYNLWLDTNTASGTVTWDDSTVVNGSLILGQQILSSYTMTVNAVNMTRVSSVVLTGALGASAGSLGTAGAALNISDTLTLSHDLEYFKGTNWAYWISAGTKAGVASLFENPTDGIVHYSTGGTVNYNGTQDQTIASLKYWTLAINGSGVKTAGGDITLVNRFLVNENESGSSTGGTATFYHNFHDFIYKGHFTALKDNMQSYLLAVALSEYKEVHIPIYGDISLNLSGGTDGYMQQIAGVEYYNLVLEGYLASTNAYSESIQWNPNATIASGGTLSFGTSGTDTNGCVNLVITSTNFSLGGDTEANVIKADQFAANTGTVIYGAAAPIEQTGGTNISNFPDWVSAFQHYGNNSGYDQNVAALQYFNLAFLGSGNRSAMGDISVSGQLVNYGFNLSFKSYNFQELPIIGGFFSDSTLEITEVDFYPTFVHNNHTVTLNGYITQNFDNLGFYDLILAGSGEKVTTVHCTYDQWTRTGGNAVTVAHNLTMDTSIGDVKLNVTTGTMKVDGTFTANKGTVEYSQSLYTTFQEPIVSALKFAYISASASDIVTITTGGGKESDSTPYQYIGYYDTSDTQRAYQYYNLILSGDNTKLLVGNILISSTFSASNDIKFDATMKQKRVTYDGLDQTILSVAYYDLVLTDDGVTHVATKTASGNLSVVHQLTLGTAGITNSITLDVYSGFSVGDTVGSYLDPGSTVRYLGSGDQKIVDFPAYANLVISGVGTKFTSTNWTDNNDGTYHTTMAYAPTSVVVTTADGVSHVLSSDKDGHPNEYFIYVASTGVLTVHLSTDSGATSVNFSKDALTTLATGIGNTSSTISNPSSWVSTGSGTYATTLAATPDVVTVTYNGTTYTLAKDATGTDAYWTYSDARLTVYLKVSGAAVDFSNVVTSVNIDRPSQTITAKTAWTSAGSNTYTTTAATQPDAVTVTYNDTVYILTKDATGTDAYWTYSGTTLTVHLAVSGTPVNFTSDTTSTNLDAAAKTLANNSSWATAATSGEYSTSFYYKPTTVTITVNGTTHTLTEGTGVSSLSNQWYWDSATNTLTVNVGGSDLHSLVSNTAIVGSCTRSITSWSTTTNPGEYSSGLGYQPNTVKVTYNGIDYVLSQADSTRVGSLYNEWYWDSTTNKLIANLTVNGSVINLNSATSSTTAENITEQNLASGGLHVDKILTVTGDTNLIINGHVYVANEMEVLNASTVLVTGNLTVDGISLSVLGASTLNVTGNLNLNAQSDAQLIITGTSSSAVSTVTVGGNLNMDSSATTGGRITLNYGVLKVTGTLTTYSLYMNNASTLVLYSSANDIGEQTIHLDGTANTVEYASSTDQDVMALNYYNLIFSGDNKKTLLGDISIAGNFTVTSSVTVDVAGYSVTFNGANQTIPTFTTAYSIAGNPYQYATVYLGGTGVKTWTTAKASVVEFIKDVTLVIQDISLSKYIDTLHSGQDAYQMGTVKYTGAFGTGTEIENQPYWNLDLAGTGVALITASTSVANNLTVSSGTAKLTTTTDFSIGGTMTVSLGANFYMYNVTTLNRMTDWASAGSHTYTATVAEEPATVVVTYDGTAYTLTKDATSSDAYWMYNSVSKVLTVHLVVGGSAVDFTSAVTSTQITVNLTSGNLAVGGSLINNGNFYSSNGTTDNPATITVGSTTSSGNFINTGTFVGSTGDLTVYGNFTTGGIGVFTAGVQNITIDGTLANAATFNAANMGAGKTLTINGSFQNTGTLTVGLGGTTRVGGDWNNTSSAFFNANSGSVIFFNGSATDQTTHYVSGTTIFYNLTLDGTSAGGKLSGTGDITISNDFTETTPNNSTIEMLGGTFTYSKAANQLITAPYIYKGTYYNLYLLATSGYYQTYNSGTVVVSNNLTIGGSVSSTTKLYVNNGMTIGGTLTANRSTVIYQSTIAETVATPSSGAYYDLVLSSATTKTASGNLSVSHNLFVETGAVLRGLQDVVVSNYLYSNGTVYVAGNLDVGTIQNGVYGGTTYNGGAVIFNGSSSQQIDNENYYQLGIDNGNKSLSSDITTRDGFIFGSTAGTLSMYSYNLTVNGAIAGNDSDSYFLFNYNGFTGVTSGVLNLALGASGSSSASKTVIVGTTSTHWTAMSVENVDTSATVFTIRAIDGIRTPSGGTQTAGTADVDMTFVMNVASGSAAITFVDSSVKGSGWLFNAKLMVYNTSTSAWDDAAGGIDTTSSYYYFTSTSSGTSGSDYLYVTKSNATGDADDGTIGTLRLAVAYANKHSGSTIVFADALDGQTITLAFGQLNITTNMTIDGLGNLTINGGGSSRIFNITDSNSTTSLNVTITGLTLTKAGGDQGGAIYNDELLVLNNLSITNSSATYGGGIYNAVDGGIVMTNVTVSGNSADYGGGIYTLGLIKFTVGTISGNTAKYDGGGVYVGSSYSTSLHQGSLYAERVTIANNTAGYGNVSGYSGGGIYNAGGNLQLVNTTISGNTAEGTGAMGGGIYNGTYSVGSTVLSYGAMTAQAVTINDNTSAGTGGGIYSAGDMYLYTTTIANNASANGTGSALYLEGGDSSATLRTTELENVTVAYNLGTTATASKYAVDMSGYAYLELLNSIVACNNIVAGGYLNFDLTSFAGYTRMVTSIMGGTYYTSYNRGSSSGTHSITQNNIFSSAGLTDNGGWVKTIALAYTDTDSSTYAYTIDAGTNNGADLYDARGYYLNATRDLGAYEGTDLSANSHNAYVVYNSNKGTWYTTIGDAVSAASSGQTLVLVDSRIYLNSTIAIDRSLTITGGGSDETVLDGKTLDGVSAGTRLMEIYSASGTIAVSLDGIGFTNGKTTTDGGAIYNNGESLTIANSAFYNNTATVNGGAIYNNAGTVVVSYSEFHDNTAASGGAIYNNLGTLTISYSTLSNNTATVNGGAIASVASSSTAYDAVLTITSSTLNNNTAATGGAIYAGGKVEISNSTMAHNTAGDASAMYLTGAGNWKLTNDTIAYNNALLSSGYAVEVANGTMFLVNALLANNWANNHDTSSTYSNQDINYISGNTVHYVTTSIYNGTLDGTPYIIGFDSTLFANYGALVDNGGWTKTVALANGSLSGTIDAIEASSDWSKNTLSGEYSYTNTGWKTNVPTGVSVFYNGVDYEAIAQKSAASTAADSYWYFDSATGQFTIHLVDGSGHVVNLNHPEHDATVTVTLTDTSLVALHAMAASSDWAAGSNGQYTVDTTGWTAAPEAGSTISVLYNGGTYTLTEYTTGTFRNNWSYDSGTGLLTVNLTLANGTVVNFLTATTHATVTLADTSTQNVTSTAASSALSTVAADYQYSIATQTEAPTSVTVHYNGVDYALSEYTNGTELGNN